MGDGWEDDAETFIMIPPSSPLGRSARFTLTWHYGAEHAAIHPALHTPPHPFAVLPALHNLGLGEHVALSSLLYSYSQLLLRCKNSVARGFLFFSTCHL